MAKTSVFLETDKDKNERKLISVNRQGVGGAKGGTSSGNGTNKSSKNNPSDYKPYSAKTKTTTPKSRKKTKSVGTIKSKGINTSTSSSADALKNSTQKSSKDLKKSILGAKSRTNKEAAKELGLTGITRSQARKDSRMTNKATRRADRSAERGLGDKGTAQYAANLGAEENRIKTNRIKRREFAYNMAKAAGSGDAGSFDPRSRRTKGDILANNGSTGAPDVKDFVSVVGSQEKAKELEEKMTTPTTENSLAKINAIEAQISSVENEFKPYYDDGQSGLMGQPDSNPSSYMQDAYRKKRG